jgi:hypothetical protein
MVGETQIALRPNNLRHSPINTISLPKSGLVVSTIDTSTVRIVTVKGGHYVISKMHPGAELTRAILFGLDECHS